MKAAGALALALLLCGIAARPPGAAISIDVRDAELTDVIALLAAESGANIVADASLVPQRITLHLHGVTFGDALDVLVQSRSLQIRRIGGVLLIGTAESMSRRYGDTNDAQGSKTAVLALARAQPDDAAKELAAGLPPGTVLIPDKRTASIIVSGSAQTIARARVLLTALDAPNPETGTNGAHVYRLRYAKPLAIAANLKGVLPDGSFVADDAQNAIVVSGNDDVQRSARQFIASMDVESAQVLFEVRVADVIPDLETRNVGIEFGGYDFSGQTLSGAATYAFAKSSLAINAKLNALVSTGRAQILATPKLVSLNNKEADLLIGQTYPVIYYDARVGGQQVQFVDVGVKLRLTATIGSEGSVTAEMHPEYSAIQSFVGGYPVIANRKIDSTLRVRDNETIVLGGLLSDIDSQTVTKVPWLADIPVFGKIFQNRQSTRERDEVVFFITPHIMPAAAAQP
ncbi:MAG: secretin N-terminal domain-containing protein [Candidatus Baltobacteraceae bacterium]